MPPRHNRGLVYTPLEDGKTYLQTAIGPSPGGRATMKWLLTLMLALPTAFLLGRQSAGCKVHAPVLSRKLFSKLRKSESRNIYLMQSL